MGMNALEVRRRVMMAQPHEAVASGAVASFRTDVISPLPLEFDLEPIQAGTGDPSPDNIRPITGHDGFTRTGTGKNLVDLSVIANQGSNVTEIENGYAFTATSTQYNTGIVFSPPLAGVYTLSAKCKNGTGTNFRLRFHYTDGTTRESNATGTEEGFVTIKGTSKLTKSIDSIRFNWSSSGTFEVKELQLEQGAVATAYQPFGHSYSTTFPTPPGTVYGGHITDNGDGTGTLVVDRAIYTITGNETWTAWGNAYFSNVLSVLAVNNASSVNCIASMLAGASTGDLYAFATGVGARNSGIYIDSNSYANLRALVGMTIVYKRATPVTYDLSMDVITSLMGQNHIWVDNADEVSVEYWGH